MRVVLTCFSFKSLCRKVSPPSPGSAGMLGVGGSRDGGSTMLGGMPQNMLETPELAPRSLGDTPMISGYRELGLGGAALPGDDGTGAMQSMSPSFGGISMGMNEMGQLGRIAAPQASQRHHQQYQQFQQNTQQHHQQQHHQQHQALSGLGDGMASRQPPPQQQHHTAFPPRASQPPLHAPPPQQGRSPMGHSMPHPQHHGGGMMADDGGPGGRNLPFDTAPLSHHHHPADGSGHHGRPAHHHSAPPPAAFGPDHGAHGGGYMRHDHDPRIGHGRSPPPPPAPPMQSAGESGYSQHRHEHRHDHRDANRSEFEPQHDPRQSTRHDPPPAGRYHQPPPQQQSQGPPQHHDYRSHGPPQRGIDTSRDSRPGLSPPKARSRSPSPPPPPPPPPPAPIVHAQPVWHMPRSGMASSSPHDGGDGSGGGGGSSASPTASETNPSPQPRSAADEAAMLLSVGEDGYATMGGLSAPVPGAPALGAEEKRERARMHARNTRKRKKEYITKLEAVHAELRAETAREVRAIAIEEQRKAARKESMRELAQRFLDYSCCGGVDGAPIDAARWASVVAPDVECTVPLTPHRYYPAYQVDAMRWPLSSRVLHGIEELRADTASVVQMCETLGEMRGRRGCALRFSARLENGPPGGASGASGGGDAKVGDTKTGVGGPFAEALSMLGGSCCNESNLMSTWVMRTTNATVCGGARECEMRGMLHCKFGRRSSSAKAPPNPEEQGSGADAQLFDASAFETASDADESGRQEPPSQQSSGAAPASGGGGGFDVIEQVYLTFDVMEWTNQLRESFGEDAPLRVPNTLEEALAPSHEPRIISSITSMHLNPQRGAALPAASDDDDDDNAYRAGGPQDSGPAGAERRGGGSDADARGAAGSSAANQLTAHRVVSANAAVCALTGFTERELLQTNLGWLDESVRSPEEARALRRIVDVVLRGVPLSLPLRHATKSGEPLFSSLKAFALVSASSGPNFSHILWVLSDQRDNAEDALLEALLTLTNRLLSILPTAAAARHAASSHQRRSRAPPAPLPRIEPDDAHVGVGPLQVGPGAGDDFELFVISTRAHLEGARAAASGDLAPLVHERDTAGSAPAGSARALALDGDLARCVAASGGEAGATGDGARAGAGRAGGDSVRIGAGRAGGDVRDDALVRTLDGLWNAYALIEARWVELRVRGRTDAAISAARRAKQRARAHAQSVHARGGAPAPPASASGIDAAGSNGHPPPPSSREAYGAAGGAPPTAGAGGAPRSEAMAVSGSADGDGATQQQRPLSESNPAPIVKVEEPSQPSQPYASGSVVHVVSSEQVAPIPGVPLAGAIPTSAADLSSGLATEALGGHRAPPSATGHHGGAFEQTAAVHAVGHAPPPHAHHPHAPHAPHASGAPMGLPMGRPPMAPHAAMGPSPPATSAAPYAPNPSQQAPRVDPYDVVAAVLAAEFTAFFAEARRPTSPMLDYLFRALRRERTSTFAESFIWATWMAHERDAVIATMDVGARAHEKGEHDAARAHYSRVIEMDETYAEGWNRRAAASYAKGDLNAALRDINEARVCVSGRAAQPMRGGGAGCARWSCVWAWMRGARAEAAITRSAAKCLTATARSPFHTRSTPDGAGVAARAAPLGRLDGPRPRAHGAQPVHGRGQVLRGGDRGPSETGAGVGRAEPRRLPHGPRGQQPLSAVHSRFRYAAASRPHSRELRSHLRTNLAST